MSDLQKTGIYQIINLINGKRYVGSTRSSFNKRFTTHRRELKNDKHHSKHLQFAYNKHGLNNFKFEILEIIDKNKDKQYFMNREQYYIDLFKSTNREFGYNIALKADLTPTAANPEYYGHLNSLRLVPEGFLVKHPEEEEWLHFFNLTKFYKLFELSRHKVEDTLAQKRDDCDGFKFKYANEEKNKKYEKIQSKRKEVKELPKYIVTFPNGKVEKINNLLDFCNKNNLTPANLLAVARGKRDNCKKFKCEYIDKNKYKKFITAKEKPPTFLIRNDETGEEFLVNSVRDWCIKQGWKPQESNTLRSTQKGSVKIQHKNHRCYPITKLDNNTQVLPKCDFKYQVITNTGKIYLVESLLPVAEKENINFRYLYELVSGKRIYSCLIGWQIIKL